ncbi:MAG: nucleoside hydrolase [Planctomycetota bacterium]|nr:nucleoside hydrolase [Planctomycetota bacterium]
MSVMRMSANLPLRTITLIALVAILLLALVPSDSAARPRRKIPVIFDTDICDDIDDTWALALLLQSPEFDLKLVVTAVGNTKSKAKTVAKFLEIAGRTDIPIGIGVQQHNRSHRQDAWARDYKLSSYPGKIYEDGVKALIDTVMNSRRRIRIIAVGPLPNIGAALEREPRIAEKAEFIGMHGSVRLGYGGSKKISAEYNVRAFAKDCQKVFTAPWRITITPLDTCGLVQLKGRKYRKVFEKNSPMTQALMENYRAWQKQGLRNSNKDLSEAELNKRTDQRIKSSSSILFDTVAIYLAMSTDLVKMEELPIKVTDDGYTKIDDSGKVMRCATAWKDLGAFEDYLVDRLTK